jgi:SAM-dependent MidA family methyltransferase
MEDQDLMPMTAAGHAIRAAIGRAGAISFERFMELALYAPGAGYYERPDRRIGRQGDFYTSVSVGEVFGLLLAARWVEWSGGDALQILEAGAHDGQLAADILRALERFYPDDLQRIDYRILEPSAPRRKAQQERLAPWAGQVRWFAAWEEVTQVISGVIFANELLDAFPVRRLVWDASAGGWFESGVTMEGGRLGWCRLPMEADPGGILPREMEPYLPDGCIVELNPRAEAWWRCAASRVARGHLVTFDYGTEARGVPRPERLKGTLRAYYRHRVSGDLLARPGEQDLTADVDFGRIARVGEEAGLRTEEFIQQGRWLGEIGVALLRAGGPASQWLQSRFRQFQTLTAPGHLGQTHRVLVQSRDWNPVGDHRQESSGT